MFLTSKVEQKWTEDKDLDLERKELYGTESRHLEGVSTWHKRKNLRSGCQPLRPSYAISLVRVLFLELGGADGI